MHVLTSLCVTLGCLITIAFAGSADVQKTFLHSNVKVGLGETVKFQSVNYPEDAKANLHQQWNFLTAFGGVLEITCEDFRLFESDPCGDYAVVFTENKKDTTVCGVKQTFKFTSRTHSIGVTLKTGQWPRGFLSCQVTGKGKEEEPIDKELFSFLKEKSVEIDSSEHGGATGAKLTTCKCGWANKAQSRIFGGRETLVNEYPFMAMMSYGPPETQFCGASILTPLHAISAAHCTYKKTHNNLFLAIGEHNLFTNKDTNLTQIIPIKQIIDHPEFNRQTLQNDITILVLSKPIDFSKRFFGPVCLPNTPLNLEGQYIKIIGWGRSKENPSGSPFLQKVDLRVLSKNTCHKIMPQSIPTGSPKQICAYGTGKSACSGDSGGPLLWVDPETNRFTLVGLVSFGVAECGTKMPRVSTDVNAYLDWVKKTIKESVPSVNTCTKLE